MRKKKGLGLVFQDEIDKVTNRTGHFRNFKEPNWQEQFIPNFNPDKPREEINIWKVVLPIGLCVILFFGLFLRLFSLQIVKGLENRSLAEGNRIKVKVIHAPRGVILDRNGKILAANSPGFRLLDGTKKVKFITREQALQLEALNDSNAGNLEIDSLRTYPFGERLSHVLGYTGEISEDQLKDSTYHLGDQVGETGIEGSYEKTLRGTDGGEIIEVDAIGKKLRTLREIPPIAGKNLTLTIDSDLQVKTFDLLKQAVGKAGSCCGAAVVEDPQTGQILAMVSIPSYDNNYFTGIPDEDQISEIFNNKNSPVLNRVIGGTYPPGSTYKIVTSIAGLSSGKITARTQIEDTGEIFLGPFRFTNWYFTQYGKTEGSVNLEKALQRSNDTYYYRVGELIGEQTLIDWSRKLKVGGKLGIDIPGEASGLVPDNKWKQANFGQPWYPGDTLHMAIGQGFVLTTPLQVLGFTSFIAADGKLYKPQLSLTQSPKALISDLVSSEYIKEIRKGMATVTLNGGTAWPFFNFPFKTAGKTGTAEFGSEGKTHAWYTGFAPIDDPKIALTVLVEGGGEGSSVSAPVAKEIFRWFLSENKAKLTPDMGVIATDSAKTLGE